MNETTALKTSNIYVAAFRVESRRLFVSVFHALYTFPRVLKFFLKWPLSSIIYIFFSPLFLPCVTGGILHTF